MLPIPRIWGSVDLENLAPKWKTRLPRDTAEVPLNVKLCLLVTFLMPRDIRQEEKSLPQQEYLDSHQDKIGLLLHNAGRKEHVWSVSPFGHILLLFCPVLMVNGQMKQPQPLKGNQGLEPLG